MPFNVDEKFIDAAQTELGVQFPASYRAAMCLQNGGTWSTSDEDWELYPIADTSDRKRLSRTLHSVVKETGQARSWRGFPRDAVALAGNGAGDHLVFLGRGGDLGPAVFAWRHETGQLEPVASDFASVEPPDA
jgi:hypothetical protein